MSAQPSPALVGMSIGAVLDLLRPDFPDITISKIRFLETEGLVTPQRAASGYRRFTAYDLARLRFILTAQRDHYLPLKVIRAQLDAQPDGELPPIRSAYGVPRLVSVSGIRAEQAGAGAETGTETGTASSTRTWLSRNELLERANVEDELLTALLKAGVITTGPSGYFDEHTIVILECAKALSQYGVEPRHLRAFRSAADRQSDLITQIAGPIVKAGKADARDRADELAREVAALAITLHTSLLKSAVRNDLHR